MKPSITIPKISQINGSLSEPEIHSHSFHTISSAQHMDNSYPFHTNPGLFLQSQNRASGLSTGNPHFLHRFLLVEPISIPISGLLITKIEFITQILTQQPTTVSGHSRLSQKSPKFLQLQSHVLGPIKRPIPGLFHIKHAFYYQISTQTAPNILDGHGPKRNLN